METRQINKETNSYYTEEEYKLLTDLGFSWSNASNNSYEGYDNCLYLYKGSFAYDIEVKANGFIFETRKIGILDTIRTITKNKTFEEIVEEVKNNKSFQTSIMVLLERVVLSIYFLGILFLSPILAPYFVKKYDGRNFDKLSTFEKYKLYFTKNLKKFNPFQKLSYYLINELKTHLYIFVTIFLTVVTTILIIKL